MSDNKSFFNDGFSSAQFSEESELIGSPLVYRIGIILQHILQYMLQYMLQYIILQNTFQHIILQYTLQHILQHIL